MKRCCVCNAVFKPTASTGEKAHVCPKCRKVLKRGAPKKRMSKAQMSIIRRGAV